MFRVTPDMSFRVSMLIRPLVAGVLLLAAAVAWTVHPFVHSPLSAMAACGGAHGNAERPLGDPAAGSHAPHCQMCRQGDQTTPPILDAAEAAPSPVAERTRWVCGSDPLPADPLAPGLPPRAPPSQL